jgi:uncharacterized damage-inducible protein DinB
MVEAYAVNDRMYQLILEHLDPRAWKAPPPGKGARPIAAIVAHVHNVRCKWLRLSVPHLKRPGLLDRSRCTQKQAASAMAQSAARCCEMLGEAFTTGWPTACPKLVEGSRGVRDAGDSGRVFLRDGWARPWTPGAAMFAYMLSHDAHHRGQICLIAHQLGYPLPFAAGPGLWAWEKLWKECGFQLPSVRQTRRTRRAQ